MDSIERKYRANPYEITRLFNDDVERATVYSRLETLSQRNRMVGYPWAALKDAFYGEHAGSLLLVEYDLLAQAPEKILSLIYDFIGETPFEHDMENVQYDAPEFDAPLGMSGLHKVRSKVSYDSRATILPPDLFEQYAQLSFWKNTAGSRSNVITVKSQPTASGEKS
jgi:sulfotransferase